jgi:hypothetical protein
MKRKILLYGLGVLFWFLGPAGQAMYLDESSIAEITTAEDHRISGYEKTFALSGDVAVWLDYRDPQWIPQIYGVNLSDSSHLEFEVDLDAPGSNDLAMSAFRVTYPIQELSGSQYLRVADISNQGKPLLFDIALTIPYINYFDISGRRIVYLGGDPDNAYRNTFFAADITDPNNLQQVLFYVAPEGTSIRGLTMDENRVIWSLENDDGSRAVQVADISNPAEPNISTALLPEDIYFGNLDASGAWLVACGQEDWQYRIYAVHNYQDDENWDIQELWREGRNGEYLVSGPRLDGPIAVWVTTTRVPSIAGSGSLDLKSQYQLKAAYLMGNGGFTLSTLRTQTDEICAADLFARQIVWSGRSSEGIMDLFKAAIELECGDWGYKAGDLNRNCKVDLQDFAVLAQDWLACTMPEQEDCEFGS